MTVAHVGPAPSVTAGGPAGYLAQLAAAFEGHGAGSRVLFPPGPAPTPPPPAPTPLARRLTRRVRRALGGPKYDRPSLDDLRRPGGPADADLRRVIAAGTAANAASLDQALRARAGVLFAHDLAGAEAALAGRTDQQVWLLIHVPMPLALYQMWSWAVPEAPWQEILAFPDVGAWVDRELEVCARVDRVVLPCREAVDELARCDRRFEALATRADFVLTGGRRLTGGDPEGAPGRARWELPEGVPLGLYLGNAQPYRGLDCLLAALDAVPAATPGLVAVAGPDPGTLPSHPRLRALGRVRDVGALLAEVDFVINVNRFSLFDLSTIEALELGRPLLLHATGGNRTFARLGAGCDLLPDLEPATVAGGLGRLFATPAARRAALAAASRRCYETYLTPDAFRARHEALYDAPRGTRVSEPVS